MSSTPSAMIDSRKTAAPLSAPKPTDHSVMQLIKINENLEVANKRLKNISHIASFFTIIVVLICLFGISITLKSN